MGIIDEIKRRKKSRAMGQELEDKRELTIMQVQKLIMSEQIL